MDYLVEIGGKNTVYSVRESARSKRMRLAIFRDGRLVVTIPKRRVSAQVIHQFVEKNIPWITAQFLRIEKQGPTVTLRGTPEDFKKNKKIAHDFVVRKVLEWNTRFNFTYRTISVRNTRGRWGSCTSRGVLNFNYKLIYIPERLADYVVVHELAHLQEHNHGKKFWALVASVIPDFKERQKEMKTFIL